MRPDAGLAQRHDPPPPAAPPSDADRLQLRSRFADVAVDPRDVVTFPDGLPGYERAREFVLLDVEDLAPLKVLHAVKEHDPCFLVVDPTSVLPTYRCDLSGSDRHRLGATDDKGLVWFSIVAVRDDGSLSVNLRAPVVINPARMLGRQVMPSACVYPLQFVIERTKTS
jgi:flagellar assembly factor FliW